MRDTEYLLEVTGLGKVIKEAGVPYVDLNLDDLRFLYREEISPNNNEYSTKISSFGEHVSEIF